MNKGFFAKLAAQNIRKNSKMYFPYIITCIITVAVFYMLSSLSMNPGIEDMIHANSLSVMMSFGCWITGAFAVIFLFYTNSFLIKRRKKELALFNILGMEKRHISKTLAYESLYTVPGLVVQKDYTAAYVPAGRVVVRRYQRPYSCIGPQNTRGRE